MGVSKNIIVVEDKLEAIFNYLPAVKYNEDSDTSYKPIFRFGDQKELNSFLQLSKEANSRPYPLIWMLYPSEENHFKTHVDLEDLTLILAVNTNISMLNKERLEKTFKKILFPLYDNVHYVLKSAVNTNLTEEVKITKYPNYSGDNNREKAMTLDLWDAVKTVWKISIHNNCLREIKF